MTSTLSPSLERSMDAFRSAMQAAVARMDPSSAAVSAYHLGWSAADGTPLQAPAGKGVRPTLALLSAQAGGADAADGIPAAVAVELVHNFSLLHDDVMDGDTERRHRPTVWTLWGVPSAILTGDAMLTVAIEMLTESRSEHALEATRLMLATTRELIHGQVEDLQFESRESVDLQQCQQMAARKTGSLIAASAVLGCVLVGGDPAVARALDEYGRALGMAFQLVDDLLGIWGDPAVTGKPVLSDLRARKRSLPVTYALSQDEAIARRLAGWLTGAEVQDEAGLREIADLIEATGARSWANGQAAWHIRQAEQALAASSIEPSLQAEFRTVARFVAEREF